MVAKNRPAYVSQVSVRSYAKTFMWAHEYQNPICVILTAFGHFVVFFLRKLGVHGIEWP
jgi:hypothetical protein